MNKHYQELISNAKAALAGERYNNAIQYAEQAKELCPQELMPYVIAGNAYLIRKKMADAEPYFRKAVELDGKSGERYFELGCSLLGQKKFSETLNCFGTAIELGCSPDITKRIHYMMGLLNQEEHRDEDALASYAKSEAMEGANANRKDILLRRIQIYMQNGDAEEAEHTAVQLKLAFPQELKSYKLLFKIQLQRTHLDEAAATLDEAKSYCPNRTVEEDVEIAFDEVMLHCVWAEQPNADYGGEYRKALSCLRAIFENAVFADEVRCEAAVTASEVCVKLDELDAAVDFANKVAERTEGALEAYVERSHFLLMEIALRQRDFTKTRSLATTLKKSKQINYRHTAYYDDAYAAWLSAGQSEEQIARAKQAYMLAIAYYKECMIREPGDYLARIFRAKCYADQGDYDMAKQMGQALPENAQQTLDVYIAECKGRSKK